MNSARNLAFASFIIFVILVGLLLWQPQGERGAREGLLFYCAAGIKPPVEEIARLYEEEYGVPIRISYGGSGTLLANLSVSAVGDLYLAADETYIDLAREKAITKEVIPLAYTVPVIAAAKGNPKGIASIEDLLREDVTYSLANPDAASVGQITRELLEISGHWNTIRDSVRVLKPTVNDVANDVKLGAVDAGIVWDITVQQYEDLEIVRVPELDEGRVQITVAALTTSRTPTEALRFARYLGARDRGLPIFEKYGYDIVEGDAWARRPKITLFSGSVNRPAIEETLEAFKEREGVDIDIVYNGCGILVGQMRAGAQPDAYFACDTSFMVSVGDLFMDPVELAQTDIVMLVQAGNPKGLHTLHDLTREGLRLGVCNADQSALGALTHRLLMSVGVLDEVMANVVSQVPTGDFLVNQMRTSDLDAVIVYQVNTLYAGDELDRIRIDHPAAKAVQPFAKARRGNHPQLVDRLLDAIRTAESKERFERSGFQWLSEFSLVTPSVEPSGMASR